LENEVLEIVAHNVVLLVHEMHELRIDPNFRGTNRPEPEPEEDAPRPLRFPGGA